MIDKANAPHIATPKLTIVKPLIKAEANHKTKPLIINKNIPEIILP